MTGPEPSEIDPTRREDCPKDDVCPLNSVPAGAFVRVKQINGSHETTVKLRELGFCEEQRVKLLLKHTNTSVICQVCNARIGLSNRLAESIMVETIQQSKKKDAA